MSVFSTMHRLNIFVCAPNEINYKPGPYVLKANSQSAEKSI